MEERYVKLKYDSGIEEKIYFGYDLFTLAGICSGSYDSPRLLLLLKSKVEVDIQRYKIVFDSVCVCAQGSQRVYVGVPKL